ncbi:MAG: TatD family hydrolase [Spirochaetales bacterium]|jgi:TatD DNase family protein|nr:TatD family hydrolase [Spirochaetales bacterium]
MILMDIGVNLLHRSFDRDRESVVRGAEKAGVSPLVITGTDAQDSLRAAEWAWAWAAREKGKLYSTAGVHPHNAKTCGSQTLGLLREAAAAGPVIAIGECGLDYNRDFSPRDVQREWFEKQIALAAELGLPLFLHERDAFDDFYSLLKNARGRIKDMAVHCFTGTEKELDAYLELGCYIGITGWLCDERRGRHLEKLIRKIPSAQLMLETDAPFLLPRSLEEKPRAGRNEPKYLPHIARAAARFLGKEPELLAEETFANSMRFFAPKFRDS